LKKIFKIIVIISCALFPVKGQTAQIPTIWNVPAENPNFVGRQTFLNTIGNSFKTTPFKVTVLAGPSGFGKSQIAKKYAHLNYSNYDIVWWFKGNQYIAPQFENFASALETELEFNLNVKSISHGRLIMRVKEALRKNDLNA